ncbi:MAG: M23 family metallopeptidase [Ruminococcaceae bacterium]|nr:M23 family metallopeptidase [Oscillospiraceae bacterium]
MLPYKNGTVRVTSPYGNRIRNGKTELHKGIDLVGSQKQIVAVQDGVVGSSAILDRSSDTGRTWEWGNYIRIDTSDGYSMFYCHLSARYVQRGTVVRAGDVIGAEGSTGLSTGSHLHFEVRNRQGQSVDPTPFLGIDNRIHAVDAVSAYYGRLVCDRCGLEESTRRYLDQYKYASNLWRKLWNAME